MDAGLIGAPATEGHQLQEEEVWAQQPVEAEEEAEVEVCLELLGGRWSGGGSSRKPERMEGFYCGCMLK